MKRSIYEKDVFGWSKEQVQYLKNKEWNSLDIDNIIEEIEDLGRSQKRSLESHLTNLLLHLLKIEFQPNKHTVSWDCSVKTARNHSKNVLRDNPGLKQYLHQILKDSYYDAYWAAVEETKLGPNRFPEVCPWTIEEILGDE